MAGGPQRLHKFGLTKDHFLHTDIPTSAAVTSRRSDGESQSSVKLCSRGWGPTLYTSITTATHILVVAGLANFKFTLSSGFSVKYFSNSHRIFNMRKMHT